MTNQDVVFPDMGSIAAAASLPGAGGGRALFRCRGAVGAVSSFRRGGYGLASLPADDDEFLGAPAAASSRTCTRLVVEAIRASSPTRCPAVDEYAAWTVSRRPSDRFGPVPFYWPFPCWEN